MIFTYNITNFECLDVLSSEETLELLKKAQNNDYAARETLILHNIRLVYYITTKTGFNAYSSEDLISSGIIGLIKAIDTFDLNKSNNFTSYAYTCIKNEIFLFLRKNRKYTSLLSIEENILLSDEYTSLLDILKDDQNISEEYIEKERNEIIRKLIENLPEKERIVIIKTYGFFNENKLKQSEIARIINCSQSYVSRLLESAINKLKKELIYLGVIEINSYPATPKKLF